MLTELHIKNFIIIDELSIRFEKGLNILSGETGAGKSILIDAISGILGDKMTTEMIRTGFDKAVLEGIFDITDLKELEQVLDDSGLEPDDESLVIRRELYSTGKGRCFINSMQVPLQKVKEIAGFLIDIHGQNENQSIMNTARHRELTDSFGGLSDMVAAVREKYEALADLRQKIAALDMDEKEKQRRLDFGTFALKEIDGASLSPAEEEQLKKDALILENSEKLFNAAAGALQLISGETSVLQKLREASKELSSVTEFDAGISSVLDSVNQAVYSLEDASSFLRSYGEGMNFSPERLNIIEDRLALIQTLKKKYGNSIEEILAYAENLRKELNAITSGDEAKEKLKVQERKLIEETKILALKLSGERQKAAQILDARVTQELHDLGMEGMTFKTDIRQEQSPEGEIESSGKTYMLYPHGLDKIEFLISANKGEELRPLRKTASGGEMSRIMLALKNVILSADIVDTLIFDEVDTGVGGKTADIVGRKLKQLSRKRQVLLITHLPQIACMSDHHYFIQKKMNGGRITTSVKQLDRQGKIEETARMLAGEKITELSLKHAEEMIAEAEARS